MTQRIEWRTTKRRGDLGSRTSDAVLLIDEEKNTVQQALVAEPALLRVFLNDMVALDTGGSRQSVEGEKQNPDAWGELVISRASTGEVIDMDPERFWDGIYTWFRSRGVDPNLVRRV